MRNCSIAMFGVSSAILMLPISFHGYCLADKADPGKERALAAQKAFDRWAGEYYAGRGSGWVGYVWSRRWMEAESVLSQKEAAKVKAAENHLARMKKLEKSIKERVARGRAGFDSYLVAEFYRADAELHVSQIRGKPDEKEIEEAGTTRLATAVLIYDSWWLNLDQKSQKFHLRSAFSWSRLWFEAEIAVRKDKTERLAAAEAYVNRTKETEKLAKDLLDHGDLPIQDFQGAIFCRAEAEILFSKMTSTATASSDISKVRLDAAKSAFDAEWKDILAGRGNREELFAYSTAWLRAATALATTKPEKTTACEAHLARMKDLQKIVKPIYQAGRIPIIELFAANFYVADAEVVLGQTKGED